jgi:hypothetical protein
MQKPLHRGRVGDDAAVKLSDDDGCCWIKAEAAAD